MTVKVSSYAHRKFSKILVQEVTVQNPQVCDLTRTISKFATKVTVFRTKASP